jgi:hypothetical protein
MMRNRAGGDSGLTTERACDENDEVVIDVDVELAIDDDEKNGFRFQ